MHSTHLLEFFKVWTCSYIADWLSEAVSVSCVHVRDFSSVYRYKLTKLACTKESFDNKHVLTLKLPHANIGEV